MESVAVRAELPCTLEELGLMLGTQPSSWLDPFLRIAAHLGDAAGDVLAAKARRTLPPVSGERRSQIVVRPTRSTLGARTPRAFFPFEWRNEGYRSAFACLNGRILLQRTGASTVVTITGRVTSPAWLGDPLGRIIGRRAAATTVERLLASLAAAFKERSRAAIRHEATPTPESSYAVSRKAVDN